jgi:hypothetical protein
MGEGAEMPTIDDLHVSVITHMLMILHQCERVRHDNVWADVRAMQEAESARRIIGMMVCEN